MPAVMVLAVSLLVGLAAGILLRALLRAAAYLRRKTRVGEPSSSRQLLRAAGLRAEPERVVGEASFWTAVVVGLAVGVNALANSWGTSAVPFPWPIRPRPAGCGLAAQGI